MTNETTLQIRVSLERGDFTLQVNLSLPANGITVLFGPSGSGKTTVLRCVAGLEKAGGLISLGHEIWQDSATGLFKPTWQREIGYVFQEASLFEHLNVRQNLHFGLRRAGATGDIPSLSATLNLLGIGHLLNRAVTSLSGGERQRVAIARALATKPKLLLLDEPLASLDVARRKEVLPWLEKLHDQLQIPMLYVTHSVDELARLADHIVILERGTVRSCGPVTEAMVSPDVALAIGEEAGLVSKGQIIDRSAEDHVAQIRFGGGTLWVRDPGLAIGQNVRVRILARDVSLALSAHEDSTIQNRLQGIIDSIDADTHPSQAMVRVRCGEELILGRMTFRSLRNLDLHKGSPVWCQVKSAALIV